MITDGMNFSVTQRGSGHEKISITRNQDCYFSHGKVIGVSDGCSMGNVQDFISTTEVGSTLIWQLFELYGKDVLEKPDKVEENMNKAMEAIINMVLLSSPTKNDLWKFMLRNCSFTLLLAFELEDRFVVRFLGDGYVIAQNNNKQFTYIELNYGSAPPYLLYNYFDYATNEEKEEEGSSFKTLTFSKKHFKNIFLASDGIKPILFSTREAEKKEIEKAFLELNQTQALTVLNRIRSSLQDDCTIVGFSQK